MRSMQGDSQPCCSSVSRSSMLLLMIALSNGLESERVAGIDQYARHGDRCERLTTEGLSGFAGIVGRDRDAGFCASGEGAVRVHCTPRQTLGNGWLKRTWQQNDAAIGAWLPHVAERSRPPAFRRSCGQSAASILGNILKSRTSFSPVQYLSTDDQDIAQIPPDSPSHPSVDMDSILVGRSAYNLSQ